MNLYISYTLGLQLKNWNVDFTLGNCLFGSAKLTKNADLDKYKYTGYGIGFDFRSEFLFTDGSYGIFGADMSSWYMHADNKRKDNLILGEGPSQRLDDTTLTASAKYPINFTQSENRFALCLHYNRSNNLLFVNATKVYQFKAKKL